MELVDTHCHIHEASTIKAGDDFVRNKWGEGGFTDPQPLIDEAVETGVTRLICVGCTLRDSKMAVELAGISDHCWASIGIHPHEAKNHLSKTTQSHFSSLLKDGPFTDRIIAIGECGLDYFYNHSPKDDQVKMLEFQLELAQKHDLPVIFHVREAFDDFWPIYDQFKGLRGVLHSYTDNVANLEKALKRGLYIGVNGIATFNKDAEKTVTYVTIPQQSLLLETDAPFLTPTPYRGTICQPKHIRVTAEFLAELRHESIEQIANATTQNARRLFSI